MDGSSNLDLYLSKGYKYEFFVDTVGFPIAIKTARTLGNVNLWNDGVRNNVIDYGTLEFVVPPSAPSQLFYVCINDPDMSGNIFIT